MLNNIAQQTSSGRWAEVVIADLKSVRGGMAILWAVVFGLILAFIAPQEWQRDMKPTLDFFEDNPLIGGELLLLYGPLIAQTLIILAPILINSMAARYAHILKAGQIGVIIVQFFDSYTDWPSASESFNAFWSQPVFTDQPIAWLWWVFWRLLWQVWCTDGLELICVASAVGFVVCVAGALKRKPAGASFER